MLIIGLWLSTVYWLVESLLDTYFFHRGPLSDQLFPINSYELWMRCFAVGLIICFSAYAERMVHGRREAETALDESENRYCELVENANSIILRMSPTGVITYLNRFGLKFFGYSEDELMGQNAVGRIVPETDMAGRDLAAMIADIGRNPERYVNNENENTYRDGSRVWISWTNKAIYDGDGRLVEVLCIGNDLSERKRAEEKLEQALKEVRELSLVDQLTDLRNRRGFLTLAEQQLKVADRTQVGVGLFFIDLDNLKCINDKLGHKIGDQALVEAADVLRETFRESDIIARLDGDEFAVLLIHASPDVPFSAERLARTLEAHNAREGRAYELQMSVGVAVYDCQSRCTIQELLSRADDLMYAEKRRRKAGDGPSSPDTYPAEACER